MPAAIWELDGTVDPVTAPLMTTQVPMTICWTADNFHAAGASAIYQAPAMICAESPQEGWLAGYCAGPHAEAVVQPWTPGVGLLPPPGRYADLSAQLAPPAEHWPGSALIRVVTASARPDRSPVFVMVAAKLAHSHR